MPSGLSEDRANINEPGVTATAVPVSLALKDREWSWKGRVDQGDFIEIKGINGEIHAERGSGNEVEVVAELRGKGLMSGFRLTDALVNADVVSRLLEENLLTVPAGDNVVRLLPPLIIGEQEVSEAIAILEEVFRSLEEELSAKGDTRQPTS